MPIRPFSFIQSLAARGESRASHRGRRGVRPARREEGEDREYSTDEPRRGAGCLGGRIQRGSYHGLLGFLFVLLACSVSVHAAEITGRVIDPSGRPTPGAQLLLTQTNTIIATVISDRLGEFRFSGLVPGDYRLRVALDGFQADPIVVSLDAENATEQVAFALRVSAVSESIVVTASAVERPRSQVADSVTVISANDLKTGQIETVSQALRSVPSLGVTASGGRGATTSLFARGAESNFTLVLIDGVHVNSFGGGFDFAHLPVTDIERIEVVRGPQSAQWGADAIGGVVQIITRSGGPLRASGLVEGGSQGTFRVGFSASGSRDEWVWGAGYDQLDSDGFTGTAPGSGEPVSNDDYQRRDLSLNGGWHGARTDVRGTFRYGTNERGFPGPYGSDPGGTYGGIDTVSRGINDTRIFSADVRQTWTPRVRQQFFASRVDLDSEFVSLFGDSFSDTTRFTFRTQVDAVLSTRVDLSAGLDIAREQADNTFVTDGTFEPIPIKRLIAGYFAEARYDAHDQLLLSAGVRFEQIRRDALGGFPSPFGSRPDFEDQTASSVNPKVSVAYFLQPSGDRSARWTRLRASAGTGFRPPDVFEIAFTDNPDLKPERSRSIDFGAEQALAGTRLVFEAAAFFNRYEDLIVAVGPALLNSSRFRTDNIANSRARGLELGAVMRAGPVELRGTYTWMDTEVLAFDRSDEAPPPSEVGDPLLRRPRHQGLLDVRLLLERVSAYATVGARGRVVDVDPSAGSFGGVFDNPGYGVVHIGASAPVWGTLELYGRVDNLFDRHYDEALGFPALRRTMIGGFRVATR